MTTYNRRYRTIATNAIHAGRPEPPISDAVITPVFQSANYLMADETEYETVRYIRLNNSPNHHSLHARLQHWLARMNGVNIHRTLLCVR